MICNNWMCSMQGFSHDVPRKAFIWLLSISPRVAKLGVTGFQHAKNRRLVIECRSITESILQNANDAGGIDS